MKRKDGLEERCVEVENNSFEQRSLFVFEQVVLNSPSTLGGKLHLSFQISVAIVGLAHESHAWNSCYRPYITLPSFSSRNN